MESESSSPRYSSILLFEEDDYINSIIWAVFFLWGYHSRSIPPPAALLTFFLLLKCQKLDTDLRPYNLELDAPHNFFLYKNLEKLYHIMINKKDFPVIVFHSRSIFPTGALLLEVQISFSALIWFQQEKNIIFTGSFCIDKKEI